MIHAYLLALATAQYMNLNGGLVPTFQMSDGGMAARIWVENAQTTVNVSGGGGSGSGAPVDGGYLTITAGSTGSTNERVLTAGSNIVITPGPGTATIAVTGTVPNATAAVTATTSTTAGSLSSNPADCSVGQYATTIAANGDLTCAQVSYSQVTGTPSIPADTSAAGYITKTAEAGLSNEFAMGALGTGIVKNTTATGVPSIAVSGTDYAPATSGSAILKGNGAGGFSSAVSGTDYEPAGTYSGVGTCGANTFATALNDTASPTCAQPSFSNLSGSATTGQLPTVTVAKGGTNLTTLATNQLLVGTAADTLTAKTVPDCDDSAGNHLNFDNSTQTFTCGTTSSTASGAPTNATYITQTANGTLTNEQALGSLATGLLKNTTTTGVLTVAVAGTDYVGPTSGTTVLLGNGSGQTSNYAGTSCTNQFPRSLSAAGAATCQSVALGTDVSGTLTGGSGGLGAVQPTCSGGDFLTCNGTTCSCATPAGGGGGLTHAETQRLVFLGQ